jgi:hypothetical protein
MKFLFFFPCAYCEQESLLVTSRDVCEAKCANGLCGQISEVPHEELTRRYVELLETTPVRPQSAPVTGTLYETRHGWRYVLNAPEAIQFALLNS